VVRFEAVPDFTLGYEDIRALVADEDIRAAAFVEGLPGAGWIMGGQGGQQKVPEVLFVLAVISAWVAFHGNAKGVNDRKNVLVGFVVEGWIGRRRARRRGRFHDKFFRDDGHGKRLRNLLLQWHAQ